MAWTDTKNIGDLLMEFERRYEWVGELGVMEWGAVNEEHISNALYAMWDDWRDVVRPALDREMKRLRDVGGDDA
jgi:hypothetical protein